MIDRNKAIEELNSKITFIPRKFADSNMTIKEILEAQERDPDFLSTEGEIVTLLRDNPMKEFQQALNELYLKKKNWHEAFIECKSNNAPYLDAELKALKEVMKIVDDLRQECKDGNK